MVCGSAYHGPFRLDPFCGDVHLQRIRLRVLRVPKVEDLVEQLVHQHKVVLDSLLVELPKVRLSESHQPVQKLKHQRGIRIALRHRHQVDVLVLDMAEGGGAEGENGRAYLGIRYHLNAEHVGEARAAVVAEGAKYKILALLVEYQDSGEHGEDGR
jgi:hypothetical protein